MHAQVGDDQYQDDRETILLQEEVACRLGKEQALWVPSGTMANQIALRVVTSPGDDVIVGTQSHAVWHEAGGGAANAGVHFTEIGQAGLFTARDVFQAIKPRDHHIYPPTTMVQVENTHNRCGGKVFDQEALVAIGEAAKNAGIFSYLDGARIWNAAIASGQSVAAIAAPFDGLMVSLSKGLGAPGGSVLAGDARFIKAALRYRRMLGGAMRQTGYYAAAGRFALKHNVAKLFTDHQNAKQIAKVLAECHFVDVVPAGVHTNIVVFKLRANATKTGPLIDELNARGVLVNALDDWTVRLVTHLDVDATSCAHAAMIMVDQIEELSAVGVRA